MKIRMGCLVAGFSLPFTRITRTSGGTPEDRPLLWEKKDRIR